MITAQIEPDIVDSITSEEILDKLSDYEKQFIKAEEVIYDYGDVSFIEYNKSTLTYIPPKIFRYKLIKMHSLFKKG